MSTMLEESGGMYVVSTISAAGKQRKMPRGRVMVPKGDVAMRQAEIVRQAKALRVAVGVKDGNEEQVV